ncbi:molybdopterin cofactor-binding domain-containing protein [Actinopolymorpha cephalotaxi]|uniref:CO/xanthine dehydrogenase Mo-binding subunit/aerobic-type carbon monoxide dehydrogenase small subunit (CoxS/CutS family) n=1 Tax=Actinopolymorpha cephalotaxi TaxID=504797 RepID=A0ABX2S5S2_9ACTN|nr:molybdopterin cofactor-binding domain-containing protein [Actinopolymorpha cephalotaxi]NYH84388.1 CO/xanthine dehydrogenase Mo-binding subunit/aerobic-type carbon monoxide dehydrogenase small subunit (CoxS/CutS family) [Actinopolymorpha cephalotaxi]
MTSAGQISTVVNDTTTDLDLDPDIPLVTVLRNDLGLRGVRQGCAIGECGACVVLVDGRAERSCQLPLSAVAGRRVTTPEGLGTPDRPHPIQQAFLDRQAAQCGYCLNGIIMSTAALLDGATPGGEPSTSGGSSPHRTEGQIQAALAEHLCRCGTHHRILRTIRELAGHEQSSSPPPVRVDDGADGRGAPEVAADVRADPAEEVPAEPGRPTEPPAARTEPLPGALATAPNVEDWLRPLPDGRIEVRSGRAELGQGVRTALAQIVAAELGVPLDRLVVRSAATDGTPDEGYTAGSNSLEAGGTALARAAVAYRRLAAEGDDPPTGPIRPDDQPRWASGPVGEAAPRSDLPAKLTGAPAYVHDLALPGMLYARALLPPREDARPVAVDLSAARDLPGVEAVLHDGRLLLVVATREEVAVRAVRRIARTTRWEYDHPGTGPAARTEAPVRTPVVEEPGAEQALASGRVVRASYAKPYEAHASVAPSSAVALVEPERTDPTDHPDRTVRTTVWTHSQGVYPLRRELAAAFGLPEDALTVRHVDGPGCYGHNGADDAAGFAVAAARAVPGRPVRFQYAVQDEFGWEPYGPPMSADLAASLDADGRVTAWRHRIRTDAHTARPHGTGDRLVVSWLRANAGPRPWSGGGEGGVRSAEPLYELGARDIVGEYAPGPLRTSALRSLGGYFNTFAIESFMDELAEAAGADPVAFRLAHLRDERARAVLEAAAAHAGWRERVGPTGQGGQNGCGQGVAVTRYKGSKAYVAQVAEVDVDAATGMVAVRRVVVACDAGVVVNPDGLRNQLEGGVLQGLSRALYEQVRHGADGVESLDWTTYPVLRFADVPALEVVLLDRPGLPPLGAGEASTPPTPAALANAVDDAVGIRVRELPLTPDRLRARLEELTDAEQARVRI